MSSTTERPRSRGQALALFALSLTAVLLTGALAFDAGLMYVERRDQQNAADAAAIAGARYLTDTTSAAALQAESTAYDLAAENGFDVNDAAVNVLAESPPISGPNQGRPGYIEVQISTNRPSFFAGIMGVLNWPVSARAVAVNSDGSGGGYSILALEEEDCGSMYVGGNGAVLAYGDIQVNSSCDKPPHAMTIGGTGTITVDILEGACDVVGTIDPGDPDQIVCQKHPGAPLLPDPLAGLPCIGPGCPWPYDAYPPLAPVPVQVDGVPKDVPEECPNSGHKKAATMDEGAVCAFGPGYAETEWRLFPGTYPGGLGFDAGTYYLEPGIYFLAGGLTMNSGGASLISVESGGTTFCSDPDDVCGVMFYNGEMPIKKGVAGPIHLNGGSADILLHPIDHKKFGGVIIYQDRAVSEGVTINGSDSVMQLRGTVYVAEGLVTVNGSSPDDGEEAQLIMDQIIADTYKVNGADGSTILALNNEELIYKLRAAGLVE